MKALALSEILLITADLDRAGRFYAEGLGFEAGPRTAVEDPAWLALLGLQGRRVETVALRLGEQRVTLVSVRPSGHPYPADSTASDLWFQHLAIVVADMAAAHARVMAAGALPISESGPEQLPPATGSVHAFKFRDPDGHPLELLFFPPGTGDDRWHRPDPPLFLGIDHSAIAVSDAAQVGGFYRDTLGLSVTATGVNRGPAQTRLDDIPHDVVDVLALRTEASTPHVELLGYHAGARRPMPQDAGPANIAATRLVFAVDTVLDGTGVLTLEGGAKALSLTDPDGHRLIARVRA